MLKSILLYAVSSTSSAIVLDKDPLFHCFLLKCDMYTVANWPDFHWNVSKPWLQRVDLFKNYAIVAMQSDNVTF